MCVGDNELDAAKPASREIAQELQPERLSFARSNGYTDNFPYTISVVAAG